LKITENGLGGRNMCLIYFALGSGVDCNLQMDFLDAVWGQREPLYIGVKISCHFGDNVTW
jgi:hypothetical protein